MINVVFRWSDEFETGLESVDSQHKHLVELINEVGTRVSDPKDDDLVALNSMFGHLTDYALQHFAEEEALMMSMNVDHRHFYLHLSEHHAFADKVEAMSEQASQGSASAFLALAKFLTSWLARHILSEDQTMAEQIRLIKSGCSPQEAFEQATEHHSAEIDPLVVALNRLYQKLQSQGNKMKQLNEQVRHLESQLNDVGASSE